MTQTSFISVSPESHFPIQNLPYGIFSTVDTSTRAGVAIGDFVLDLAVLEKNGLLDTNYFNQSSLNAFMAAGRSTWTAVRQTIQQEQ